MTTASDNDEPDPGAGLAEVREGRPGEAILDAADVRVGGEEFVVMAGPCAVESRDQLLTTAREVQRGGARILRGGAFKPRTSPYTFQGLEEEGLELLAAARSETGLPVVTEVMETRQVELVGEYADVLQVGSRNMHDSPLLEEVGRSGMPVLLKRGWSASIDEFLFAAEYVLNQGNDRVMLCERGIRTFETATRNTLDLGAVPVLKRRTHLPVIVDPSHGTGRRWMIAAMSRAALAVGADGLLVEVHESPEEALCDGEQSLDPPRFHDMMEQLRALAEPLDRTLAQPAPVPA